MSARPEPSSPGAGPSRVLILGGYGTFGGRLARLVADEAGLVLLIAGRSLPKARAFCDGFRGAARAEPLRLDRNGDVEAGLRAAQADLVVDASGPFQAYGDAPYRVVEACLRLAIPYVDLADGADFVRGIGRFDAEARARGVPVIAGASSFPALTAAAVERLARGMAAVEAVEAGVAPSPHATVGINVMRAIAGYAGRPVPLVRDGLPATGTGLAETRRLVICPPGRLPLDTTRFALVDVPDLTLIPERWPALREAWVGAGTAPESLHRLLSLLARLTAWRLLPGLSPLAPLFHRASRLLRWGEHRGGLVVRVRGRDAEGAAVERAWHLLAEGDDGPFIPAMAAAALIRRARRGDPPPPGARSAAGEVTLEDYEAAFAGLAIRGAVREAPDPSWPLYRRVLGEAWGELPEEVRRMHEGGRTAEGEAEVERGSGVLARLIGLVFRLPAAGARVPVRVRFEPMRARTGPGEVWRRSFAGRPFVSVQTEGRGAWAHLVAERFGPVTVGLALVAEDGKLNLVVRRWSVLGIPMPARLAPGGEIFERVEEGRFRFHVEIAHPLTGLLVRYRGWLVPTS